MKFDLPFSFRKLDHLHTGELLDVYRAVPTSQSPSVDDIVLIKEGRNRSPESLARLRREYSILARSKPRQGDEALALFENAERPQLVLKYFHGQRLDVVLKLTEGLPVEERIAAGVEIVSRILDVVAWLHSAAGPLIHGALNPRNILVGRNLETRIIGFERASLGDDRLERAMLSRSGIGYLAPEQVRGEAATVLTDLYSVGVVLAEFCLGANPFIGRNDLETLHNVERGASALCQAKTAILYLEQVLRKATTREPDSRFESAQEFQQTLREFQQSPQLTVARESVNRFWGLLDAATDLDRAFLSHLISGG